MIKKISLSQEVGAIGKVFIRFPLSVLSFSFFTVILLNLEFFKRMPSLSLNPDKVLTLLLAGGLIITALFLDAENRPKYARLLKGIAILFPIMGGAYLYHQEAYVWPVISLCIGAIVATLYAPYAQNNNRNHFWTFNYRLLTETVFALLISGIQLLGIFLILYTLDYLFHVRLATNQYVDWGIITTAWIAPLLTLSRMPDRFDEDPRPEEGKALQALLNYVAAPLLLVFGFIINLYGLKIAFDMILPRGHVGYIVASFGLLGLVTYLLGNREQTVESNPHTFFRNHFFKLLVIPLALMGIGLYVRISEYGFVEKRYALTLIFLFLSATTLDAFLQKDKGKITKFSLGFASLLLLGFVPFGPLGITKVCESSQINQLKLILETNQILVLGKITPSKTPLPEKTRYRIESILRYLHHSHDLAALKALLNLDPKKYSNPDMMAKHIGLIEITPPLEQTYFSYDRQSEISNEIVPFSCQGFDVVSQPIEVRLHPSSEKILPLNDTQDSLHIKMDSDKSTLSVRQMQNPVPIIHIHIKDLIKKLIHLEKNKYDSTLIFDGSSDKYKVRLIIMSFNLYLSEILNETYHSYTTGNYLTAIILVGKK